MASNDSVQLASQIASLHETETALLDLAADDHRDVPSLSGKESLILQLYDQIQELELEHAVLEQELEEPRGEEDVGEELRAAERALLEARATYTVRRKAVETVLMTDPILKAVHLKATSPAERALLPLIHRRDLLSLVHENLATAQASVLESLSNNEVDNLRVMQKNRVLVRTLLDLTTQESSWRDQISDASVKTQMEEMARRYRKTRAQWDNMKGVISAVIVGSGIDWARDDKLRDLVLDDLD